MNLYPLSLKIQNIQTPALNVRLFTLVNVEGNALPPFEAGAHIEMMLPNGLPRSYSLLNNPGQNGFYQIAVHLSPSTAGGSRYLHEEVAEGDILPCSEPRNHFPLHLEAESTCLIAGGIGITPLKAMAHQLSALGKPWQLHYCARTPEHAAFVEELQDLASSNGNQLHCYFDSVPGGQSLNINDLITGSSVDTHFYCCGPNSMLQAYEEATSCCRERAHMEYFSAKLEAALEGGYEVELARSGLVLNVPSGKSILDVVMSAGVNVPTSCREGICGSCETRIIQGEADHRDAVLTPEEQQENTSMMICCSGAKSARLVLDL